MIASEDRHVPKTKITHRYNPYSKSWVRKGREFKHDEQQNPLAGGQVRTEEITQSELSSLEQADRMLDQREKLRQNAMSYGMPSENPPAKIPAEPGQSGSSGVYRTQTGPITLDDMERILGSVYAEKQACGCSHPCQQPCTCSTSTEKGRILKGHTLAEFDTILSHTDAELRANGVSRSQILSARRLKMELESNRKQWESENEGTYVPKEFGLESLKMPEFQQSIARDCHCSNRTDKTIQCSCLVRKESS